MNTAAGPGPGRRGRRRPPPGRRRGRGPGLPASTRGKHVGAQPVDGVAGGLVLRCRGRARPRPASRRPRSAIRRGRDLGDARVGRDRGDERLEDARVARDVDGDDQRAVGAGAEAVGDEVVGAALGARLAACVPSSGKPRRSAEHRRRQREQQDGGAEGVRHRVPRRRARPTAASAALDGVAASEPDRRPLTRCPASPRNAGSSVIEASTITSTTSEIADPAGGDERDAGDGQAEDRDDDGAAGEDDGAAGGGERRGRPPPRRRSPRRGARGGG